MIAAWSSKSQKGLPQLRKPDPTAAVRASCSLPSAVSRRDSSDDSSVGALPKRGDLPGGGKFCSSIIWFRAATAVGTQGVFNDQVALQIKEILLQFKIVHAIVAPRLPVNSSS